MNARGTSPQVLVVTEAKPDTAGLEETAASLAAQTFGDWEWLIITTDGAGAPPIDDARARVVCQSNGARGLRQVLDDTDGVAFLEAGQVLPPTALEKWLWFLESHPAATSVQSTAPGGGSRIPRLLRRVALADADWLRAGATIERGLEGFVPIPDDRPGERRSGDPAPGYLHGLNGSLPHEHPIRNSVKTTARRLLLIVPWMTIGGADAVNLNILDGLAPLGWEATVCTSIDGAHDLYREYERRTADLFPLAHFLSLRYYPAFLRYLIQSRRPDVVLVSNSELGYRLLPYLRATCPGTPLVDFCHSETEHWKRGGYPRISIAHQEFLDLTITASEHLKRWMAERGGDDARIEVCYADVDVSAFRPSATARDELRARLQLPDDEPVVLFVGRISEDKQPKVLAGALIRLHEAGCRFTAVIAGEGPDRSWLDTALGKKGVHRRMLGSVASGEVPSLMAGADVFFLPSRSEGVALTLYEAMASGTPVVGARVGGQAELVTEACGFLVERSTPAEEAERYAHAIELLLFDPARRAAVAAAARSRVETSFPLDRLGRRVDELFERAIELHQLDPRKAPAREPALAIATQTIGMMRLAWLMDAGWRTRLRYGGLRGLGISIYVLVRRASRPAYVWGIRRGWMWLPRIRDVLIRLGGVST